MVLYIVQHGLAEAPDDGSERVLTARGRAETETAARLLRDRNIQIGAVWHSGKRRARQTAEIFAQYMNPAPALQAVEGLNPTDPVDAVCLSLEQQADDLMIVGHMPHLDLLVTQLLDDEAAGKQVHVQNSVVICLARKEKRWVLEWCGEPPPSVPLDPKG